MRQSGYRWERGRKGTKEGLKSLSGQTTARILMDREMNLGGIEEVQAGDAPLGWISSIAQSRLASTLAARQREE
jgi:hypothetical protein